MISGAWTGAGRVVEKTGARVQIGFNRRFDPSHSALAKAAASGELGRLELGVITSRDPAPPPLPYLRVSGGLFRDMMIHDFDMARFLFAEEPVEVAAMGAALADPAIGVIGDVDAAMATMRMASGALCQVNCSRHCAYGYDQRIEVFGEKGMLVSANPTVTSLERYSSASVAAKGRLHHFFIERYAESYIREIDAFIDAPRGRAAAFPVLRGRPAGIAAGRRRSRVVQERTRCPSPALSGACAGGKRPPHARNSARSWTMASKRARLKLPLGCALSCPPASGQLPDGRGPIPGMFGGRLHRSIASGSSRSGSARISYPRVGS